MDEKNLINYLSKLANNNPSALQLNDDIFFDKKKEIAISVDTYNEGTHFPKSPKLGLLIKKIIRSSISDLICKGVKPKYYFISFTSPKKSLNKSNILKLINSLREEQKKYKIKISGGDSTNGNFLSFTIISLGYSSKIIKRNHVKFNDDIYISGNIGDSYLGLKFIKNKIKKFSLYEKKFFLKKYYLPDIPIKICKLLKKFANSSVDISDGIIEDLRNMINKQKYKYKINIDLIPVSKEFRSIIKKNNFTIQKNLFNGDDYQVIFTALKKDRKKIKKYAKKLNQKITIIGQIIKNNSGNILLKDGRPLKMTNFKGYRHIF